MRLIIFDKETCYQKLKVGRLCAAGLVDNLSKDSFLKRQVYSKKYKLTVKDLEKMKWNVTYEEK